MPSKKQIILVTGPARSGKSEWAEKLALEMDQSVIYLATSQIDSTDLDWLARVKVHRQRRPPQWQTQEVPRDLARAIALIREPHCLLIDSLGTWVANLLDQEQQVWERGVEELLQCVQSSPLSQIFVAEETGWGVIPAYASGRVFRDRLGSLTRQIGQRADTVYLVTGGYALDLTQLGSRT